MTLSTHVERRRRLARRTLLSLSTILCTGLATPAFAQLTAPAPVRQTVDANGVDLFNGTMTADAPGVSMGQGTQGMSHHLLNRGNGWTDNLTAALHQEGNTVTVSMGGVSDSFTVSGGSFAPTQGYGATLMQSGNVFTYTAHDGTVVHFDKGRGGGAPFYASDGRATDRTAPDGSVLRYSYDSLAYCSKSKQNSDICTQHSVAYRLASITNSYGYRVTTTYADMDPIDPNDANVGNSLQQYFTVTGASLSNAASSASTSASYRSTTAGSTMTVTGEGHTVSYRMNGNTIVGITRAGSTSETVTIGYTGARVSSVAKGGGTWSYAATDANGTRTVTVTDPASKTTTYTFDVATAMMRTMTDALGHQTTWDPDASGRVKVATSPDGTSTEYGYDARGNVTSVVSHPRSGSGLADLTTSASYPTSCSATGVNAMTCNSPTTTTAADGAVTSYAYKLSDDGAGLKSVTVTSPAVDVNGTSVHPVTVTTYSTYTDYFGGTLYKPTSTTTCRTLAVCDGANGTDAEKAAQNADRIVTTTDYGTLSANNLLPVSVSRGSGDGALTATTAMGYDAVGDLRRIDGPLPGTGDTVSIDYGVDRLPELVMSSDPGHDGLKRRAVRTHHNGSGEVDWVEQGTVDAYGSGFSALQRVETSYDDAGHRTQDTLSMGGTTYQLTQYGYDAFGRVTCQAVRMNPSSWTSQPDACAAAAAGADGPDRITKTGYDELGRPVDVTSALGTAAEATEHLTYLAGGQVGTVSDGKGNVTAYAPDAFGRAWRTCFQTTSSAACATGTGDREEVGYDASGRVTSRRLRDGRTLAYAYDALGRVTGETPSADGTPWSPQRNYSYDLLGQLVRAADTNGWWNAWNYDALGRAVGVRSNVSSVTAGYDLAGRLTRLAWPDGLYVTYDHDVLGQLTWVWEGASGGSALAHLTYDDLGRRTEQGRGNGTSTRYTYAGPWLSGMTHYLTGTADNLTLGWTYDAAGGIRTRSVSNDDYGWHGKANASTGYEVDGLNRYTKVAGVATGNDDRGNLTQVGGQQFLYNGRDELYSRGPNTLYYHDATGLLGQVSEPGRTDELFQYLGDALVTEATAGGAVLRRYVPGPDAAPLVWYEGAGTGDRRYLYSDERGSVVASAGNDGRRLARAAYDEFGRPDAPVTDVGSSATVGRFGYTGQKWLPGLQLWDYKARMYSPSLGRFMQTDPIGYGDGLNWYNYVGGDPVNFIDPNGTHCEGGKADEASSRADCEHEGGTFTPDVVVTASTGGGGTWGGGTFSGGGGGQSGGGGATSHEIWPAPGMPIVTNQPVIEVVVVGPSKEQRQRSYPKKSDLKALLPSGISIADAGRIIGFVQGTPNTAAAGVIPTPEQVRRVATSRLSLAFLRKFQLFYVGASIEGNETAYYRKQLLLNIIDAMTMD